MRKTFNTYQWMILLMGISLSACNSAPEVGNIIPPTVSELDESTGDLSDDISKAYYDIQKGWVLSTGPFSDKDWHIDRNLPSGHLRTLFKEGETLRIHALDSRRNRGWEHAKTPLLTADTLTAAKYIRMYPDAHQKQNIITITIKADDELRLNGFPAEMQYLREDLTEVSLGDPKPALLYLNVDIQSTSQSYLQVKEIINDWHDDLAMALFESPFSKLPKNKKEHLLAKYRRSELEFFFDRDKLGDDCGCD